MGVAYDGMMYGGYDKNMDMPNESGTSSIDWVLAGVIAGSIVLGIVVGIILGKRTIKKRDI